MKDIFNLIFFCHVTKHLFNIYIHLVYIRKIIMSNLINEKLIKQLELWKNNRKIYY